VLGGLLGASVETGRIQRFLEPVVGRAEHAAGGGLSELGLSVIATAVALAGLTIGWLVYGSGRVDWGRLGRRYRGPKRALAQGFYLDDLYGRGLVLPGKAAASFAAYGVDTKVIDGAANGLGRAVGGLAAAGRRLQTGLVRTYALAFLLGAVALVVVLAVRS
jgi:NADH-quinone oxidoreductase subunit L